MTQQDRRASATMFPFARYEDASASIEWLCDAFGFEKRHVTENEDGTIAHAELGLASSVFMLGSAQGTEIGVRTTRDLGGTSGGVYVYVEDVDAHYERAKAAGAEIVREIADTDYGSREYMARDLEGNLWSFGTYLPE